jgi:hypothetical protein
MTNLFKLAATFAIVCCVIATPAQAQGNNCKDFRAILQATLDVSQNGAGWSGTVRGFLDNTIPILGILTGTGDLATVQHGQTGHEPASRMIFDFGAKIGKFVTLPDKGVFPVSPKITPHMVYPPDFMFGSYFYTGKVAPDSTVGSSGWFKEATGDIHFNGTFLVDEASLANGGLLTNIGAWNSEISGKLCNVNVQ